jgi:phosphoribosyl-ATP pyrophosphohydrolase
VEGRVSPVDAHRRALAGDSWPDLLREFSAKFGHHVGAVPGVPPDEVMLLRHKLIGEESDELLDAIEIGDVGGIARESADLLYVVIGTMLAYGIDPDPIFRAVHLSNLSKSADRRNDGKTLKGDGYFPPDIAGLLRLQGWDGRPCTRFNPDPAPAGLDPAGSAGAAPAGGGPPP